MTTERITDYHAKYFAYELTRQRRGGDVDRLAASLFDASVDLNPHQIDAALFALQNPLTKGVLLADEVGLGKTIEAALVICQYWAERRRRLLVIAPAALRKQWATELAEKFPDEEFDDEDLNGYLMYPKVFTDYAARHATYGPVRTLPTLNFFYGMEPGEEISPEIEPGVMLEIRLSALSETNEDGDVRVFFELNGQPRVIRVPNRKAGGASTVRPKAEVGNQNHVGAPMPGVVATVAAQAGAKVKQGDLLLTIEAMKMETGLHAERDATVKAVHVSPGAQIDAKDLLVEFED